jgi:hypothetical protein
MTSLDEIQRQLQSAIVGETADAGSIVLPSSTMSAEERLAVYQHAYIARLVECMRAEFPMFCRAVGQAQFDDLAAMFVAAHPPASYTLVELGRAFPSFLNTSMPADLPGRRALAELAELEWLTNEVFNGPGGEQEPPLDLAQLVPEQWDTRSLVLAPCVRLMHLSTSAYDYYRQLRGEQSVAPPPDRPSWLVVSRRDYTVQHHAVSESLFELLSQLQTGKLLAEVVAGLAASHADRLDELSANLHEWFRWIAANQIAVIRPR